MTNLGETFQYIISLKSFCLFVSSYIRTGRLNDFSRLSSGAQTRLIHACDLGFFPAKQVFSSSL
jgi:hypothetical protein